MKDWMPKLSAISPGCKHDRRRRRRHDHAHRRFAVGGGLQVADGLGFGLLKRGVRVDAVAGHQR